MHKYLTKIYKAQSISLLWVTLISSRLNLRSRQVKMFYESQNTEKKSKICCFSEQQPAGRLTADLDVAMSAHVRHDFLRSQRPGFARVFRGFAENQIKEEGGGDGSIFFLHLCLSCLIEILRIAILFILILNAM